MCDLLVTSLHKRFVVRTPGGGGVYSVSPTNKCSPVAVDMAGGAPKGAAGRRLRRVGRSRARSDQTLRPAAADHAAGHRQRHQGGRGPHPAAQVQLDAPASRLKQTSFNAALDAYQLQGISCPPYCCCMLSCHCLLISRHGKQNESKNDGTLLSTSLHQGPVFPLNGAESSHPQRSLPPTDA